MRPIHRWSLVALACALITLVPMAVRALPVPDQSVGAAQLLARMRAGEGTSYSGMVETSGRLGLPVSDHFTDVADLLGGDTRMRVWWRGSTDWRVDKLLATGEVDLFHHGDATIRWDYERAEARTSVDPEIRLPRDADLLPPALARRVLDGATAPEVTRLPARRIAGHRRPRAAAAPQRPAHQHRPRRPVGRPRHRPGARPRRRTATRRSRRSPRRSPASRCARRPRTPRPSTPAPGLRESVDDILDIADAANQFAPVTPPDRVAGLPKSPSSPDGVGIYGHGLTQVMALPLAVPRRRLPGRPAPDVRSGDGGGSPPATDRAARRVPRLLPRPVRLRLAARRHRHRRHAGTSGRRPRRSGRSSDDPDPGAHEAVRRRARGRGPGTGRRGGRRLRLPRAERLRQDHDRADAARAGAGHLGLHRALRQADAGPVARRAAAGGGVGGGARGVPRPVRPRQPGPGRRDGAVGRAGEPGPPRRRRPRRGRPRWRRPSPRACLLPGDAPAARAGGGAAAEPAAAGARRAHQRPRPAGDPRDPRPAAAAQRGGHHRLPVVAPARRGRADLRPDRRPRPRAARPAGAARRAPPADRAAAGPHPRRRPGAGASSTDRSRRTTRPACWSGTPTRRH